MNEHCTPSGHSRTLQALQLPAPLGAHHPTDALRRALYVDCETTGFSPERDPIIEIAMLPFVYVFADGRIAEILHHEALVYRNDPGRPLDPEIAALTGLTDEDLHGAHIDVQAASDLVSNSDLIIAHNARFDRPFFERALTPRLEMGVRHDGGDAETGAGIEVGPDGPNVHIWTS